MKDRIRTLMRHFGMSQKEFANEIRISEGTLSSIFSGRNKPTLNTLNNIRERFSEVNMDWLMNGIGDMFSSPSSPSMYGMPDEVSHPAVPSQVSGTPTQLTFMEFQSDSRQASSQAPNATQDMKNFDKPMRRIAEIRVFYDDGTFETFSARQ